MSSLRSRANISPLLTSRLVLGAAVTVGLLAAAGPIRAVSGREADESRGMPGESAIQAAKIRQDVSYLADDASAGRKTAGGVLEGRITDFIETEYRRLGLQPAGTTGFRQPWKFSGWGQIAALSPRSSAIGARMAAVASHDDDEGPHQYGTEPNELGVAIGPDGRVASLDPIEGLPQFLDGTPNTHNLLAVIPGSDPAVAGEFVVVGAHMDHLGTKSWGGGDTIYNGADDNGSGTGALISVARALVAAREAGHGPRRSVLVAHFSGEEMGLLGSQYYVANPTIALAKIKGMVNVDMVGRLGPSQISCGDRAPAGMSNLFHDLHDASGLGFAAFTHDIEAYMARSDQYSFFRKGIPVVFFFEGLENGNINADYHRVSDTADKLDYDKIERAAKVVFRHVMGAASQP